MQDYRIETLTLAATHSITINFKYFTVPTPLEFDNAIDHSYLSGSQSDFNMATDVEGVALSMSISNGALLKFYFVIGRIAANIVVNI